jgi:hypothetical protein
MHTGSYQHQSFWNYGLFSSAAEVSGFLEYQLYVKGIVLLFLKPLRCIKISSVICYWGLRFPQEAVVLLL